MSIPKFEGRAKSIAGGGLAFCAVTLVSVFSGLQPMFIHIDQLQPFYATGFGGILIGLGMIVLFRHRASLGGVNILALHLQDHYGIRAGKFQMAVDVAIAANPDLRVCLVDEANDMDLETLDALRQRAEEHGFQVWCCRIGIEGAGEIVVEDGEARGTGK